MGTRDLINLGISPDSGTGDSARKGGAKINELFADIYTVFGDNPIGTDNTQAFYGYRRKFSDYEYKVGELHAAGKYSRIGFRTTNVDANATYFNDSDGFDVDYTTATVPDLYLDSEFYFISRGEMVDVDLSGITTGEDVHLVLPIANTGDVIRIRESRDSIPNASGINIWTTPFNFADSDQRVEWSINSASLTEPQSRHTYIRDYDGSFKNCSVKTVTNQNSELSYDIAWGGSVISSKAQSNVRLTNSATIYEFIYLGHDLGWVFNSQNAYYTIQDSFTIHTDSWDSDQWLKLKSNITISGTEQVAEGYYMLPITSGTTGSTTRDFDSITQIMNVRVYKKVNQGGAGSVQTEVVERIRNELRRALDSEIEIGGDSDTGLATARAVRYKTVLGTEGDSESGYQTTGYTGFNDVDDLYIPMTLTTFIDNKGNVVAFSETPFKGAAVVLSLG